jgi:hypothetical protein
MERQDMCAVFWFENLGPLGIPRRRWENNIRMDFMKIAWEGIVDWIHLA